MPQGSIQQDIQDGVGTITFSHPKSNALPRQMLTELADTLNALDNENEVRVIKIQSSGDKAFCAGAFFDDLLEVDNKEEGKHFFMGFANVLNAMRTSSKLIVGRIQGKTVGGGVGLAAATDYTLATTEASIRLSELELGIGPFVVGPAIRRKIGLQGFTALSLDAASWKPATWAHENGLYTELFENTDELDAQTKELADRLSNYNPKAMKELKRTLWNDATHWDSLLEIRADTSGRLLMTDYTQQKLDQLRN